MLRPGGSLDVGLHQACGSGRIGTVGDPEPSPLEQDADMLKRLHDGDRAAMAELYDRYFDRVYSLVFNQVDRNREVAEDIVQDTFLAALKSAKGFKGRSSAYTWLCSIAYHKVADHYRRQSRERKRMVSGVDVDTVDASENPGTQPQPDSMIESAETRQVVNEALAKLPWDYRQVLILKYVEEISVQEMSQIMHRSPKSIEGLLTRSRKALQTQLEGLREG
jgi:RNA polymerase sigma-70 factor (ECF subfamily)